MAGKRIKVRSHMNEGEEGGQKLTVDKTGNGRRWSDRPSLVR